MNLNKKRVQITDIEHNMFFIPKWKIKNGFLWVCTLLLLNFAPKKMTRVNVTARLRGWKSPASRSLEVPKSNKSLRTNK